MNTFTKIWISSFKVVQKIWGCHQLPERSFFINGYQLPFCARCTGIFCGFILAIIFLLLGLNIPLGICLLMPMPLIIDGTVQLFFSKLSNNIRRFITGVLFGVAVIYLLSHTIRTIKAFLSK